jgi:hypothetical protein
MALTMNDLAPRTCQNKVGVDILFAKLFSNVYAN